MFKPLPVAIGLRYLRAKRRNGFISFISLASILGIALGVAALITTLSVMSGFQIEIRDRMLQMVSHATVTGYGEPVYGWREVDQDIRRNPDVVGVAPYVEKETLLTGQRNQPAMVRGVEPALEPQVSVISSKVTSGKFSDLQPGSFNIIVGSELAQWLGVSVGDKVTLMTSDYRITPVSAVPQLKRFTVSGIFSAGYNEYDRGMAFVHMQDLQRVLRIGEGVTGLRVKVRDMDKASIVAGQLNTALRGQYQVSDWSRENINMFRALKMEKTLMGILLSLIIAMGAFNLVSSQVMLVTDKQADIAILRTLGFSPGGVMRTFMVQGSLIGIIGTLAGVIFGVLLTLNLENILQAIEAVFGVQLLPEDVYYITGLPTDMRLSDILTISAVSLTMAFLATLYPAWRAARTAPAEALRYE
ncbi:lipoprotein-releasing ABC transporter permease subunit [Luteimonas sp. FXH3W]|uniref:Lipoprotein-releasing ABC transporter permease subunit n=1 Tax=Aquilutibacter rugosus TaxID=3115820 RepID=A0ABU7V0S6_9GAMM